jgi:hypothetical protein
MTGSGQQFQNATAGLRMWYIEEIEFLLAVLLNRDFVWILVSGILETP